jgi:nucleoside-diphosphate-sugar epimerase
MSRVLVTGARGFLGGHVVPALRADGHEVVACALQLPAPDAALAAELRGCDVVVHLAGRAHAPGAAPEELQRCNTLATEQLAHAAARAGVRLFVFVSSIAARRPDTPYGRSKAAAERVLAEAGPLERVAVLRPPMVYGEAMKGNPLRLFAALAAGWPLPLPAADVPRSVLYAGNFAAAVVAILSRPAGGTWEIADGPPVTVREFVHRSARALDRPARIIPMPGSILSTVARAGGALARAMGVRGLDARVLRRLGEPVEIDNAPFASALGWQPRFTTTEGLERTAAWYWRERAAR